MKLQIKYVMIYIILCSTYLEESNDLKYVVFAKIIKPKNIPLPIATQKKTEGITTNV